MPRPLRKPACSAGSSSRSPIINAPANEWPSLVTCLDQLWKLSYLVAGPDKSVHVTLIWIRTRELLSLSIWMHFKNKLIFHPGVSHIILCSLQCIGCFIKENGLDEAWVEADTYSSVTVTQIVNGNDYCAIDAQLMTLQVVLNDLWLDAFFDSHSVVFEALVSNSQQSIEACQSKESEAMLCSLQILCDN